MNDYEIVRESLRFAQLDFKSHGNPEWDGRLKDALAALDRIEAKNQKQASSLLEAWAACESLQAENAEATRSIDTLQDELVAMAAENERLRNELADWDERTDGFTREARAALSEEPA